MAFPHDITVAVVAHNPLAYLESTLASLADAGCPASQIVIVDVASTDGMDQWVRTRWPEIEIVRLERNDGPSPGRNVGIRHRATRYVLLMDADVQIEPDTVPVLYERMVADRTVAVGSPVVVHANDPGRIQYADTSLHFICEAVNPYLDRPVCERGSDARSIGVASTCALLLDREVSIRIGLFDERYFIGKEDGDFTHRARLAGYTILEVPAARVRHVTKPRSAWLFYFQIRNRWHFLLKNYEVRTLLVILPALAVHEMLQLIVLVGKGHGLTWLKALGGLLAMVPTLPRDRALVRELRVRHDRELLVADRLVVRTDLAGGGFTRRALSAYEAWLARYWRVCGRLLA